MPSHYRHCNTCNMQHVTYNMQSFCYFACRLHVDSKPFPFQMIYKDVDKSITDDKQYTHTLRLIRAVSVLSPMYFNNLLHDF